MRFSLLLSLAASAVAVPVVTIKNGTVIGSASGNVESFKGIPYAQPPTGQNRLRAPQTINKAFGVFTATGMPKSCPQQLLQTNQPGLQNLPSNVLALLLNSPAFQTATNTDEDCLTINVQRPAGTTSNSNLPVLFWIYGGGFEFGSTGMYDGSGFVSRSISAGAPIIYVAVNYRVSGFGFLAGKELQREGNTNLGLRDQRKGLEWVQENIKAFGGDPSKVTIWGESAGAISVFDQLIINGGNNNYKGGKLFRGAIMNSGSAVPAVNVSHPKPQAIYNSVVAAAGCSNQADTLACLRGLSYSAFLNAVNSQPSILSYQSLNLAYLPRPDPSNSFFPVSPEEFALNGTKFTTPFIIGDQKDEGTLFSLIQANLTTTDAVIDYLKSYFPLVTRERVAQLVSLYPEDPSAGSPFDTGPLYNYYPQYKRLAAILGDATFTLTRRGFLRNTTAVGATAYSYLSTYLQGSPLGTFHATDIAGLYFGLGFPVPTDVQKLYYISFVNNLDPNSLPNPMGVPWQKYSTSNPFLVDFQAFSVKTLQDTFRDEAARFLVNHASEFRV